MNLRVDRGKDREQTDSRMNECKDGWTEGKTDGQMEMVCGWGQEMLNAW